MTDLIATRIKKKRKKDKEENDYEEDISEDIDDFIIYEYGVFAIDVKFQEMGGKISICVFE